MRIGEYRFHASAREEALDAAAYYELRVEGLGSRFYSSLQEAIDRILEFPDIGTPHEAGTRFVLLRRFPYKLIYHVKGDCAIILAVAHLRRKPGYWRTRNAGP